MSDVQLSPSGPPDTVLDPEPAEALAALEVAVASAEPRSEIGQVCERWPTFLDAWARLGDHTDEPALAYAAYRTGDHRGLDRLRGSGWRGSGYVRWSHESNRGFLRALAGLERVAGEIGETAEQERCAQFLRQLDPTWPPAE